jgi:hypothetical protein
MFNLDQAIAEWRRQMLAAGIKTFLLMQGRHQKKSTLITSNLGFSE